MKTILCLGFCLMAALGRAQDRITQTQLVRDAKPTMHQKCTVAGLTLEMRGLYIEGGLLWLVLRATNHSAIDFRPAAMHLTIRDKHSLRRRALQELRLAPVYPDTSATLKADSSKLIYYAVKPRVPRKHQILVLSWGDRNGDRRLEMSLPAKVLIHAKTLK